MRILLCCKNSPSSSRSRQGSVVDDLAVLPTTHMSEVNHNLICHWLQELGHQVSVIVPKVPNYPTYFPMVAAKDLVSDNFDVLFIFKIHGLTLAKDLRLLNRKWSKVLLWIDAPCPENIIHTKVRNVTHFAWGTPDIMDSEAPKHPEARHILCEHATVFVSPPRLGPTEPRGLFAGRLPLAYLRPVEAAATVIPMRVFALWIERDGKKVPLRPKHFQEAAFQAIARTFPDQIKLNPGVNVIARAEDLSSAAFGLCPATRSGPQVLSASKFYDYLALGLPVVLAGNTPEAQFVREFPHLGRLYVQGDSASLHEAIRQVLQGSFDRKAIRDWVFNRATYKHRARTLHDFITG